MRVLFTFVGSNDPFGQTAVVGQTQKGPILTLLGCRDFDQVVLLATTDMVDRAESTASAINTDHPAAEVVVRHADLDDPTNHVKILGLLREAVRETHDNAPDAELHIAVTSGTPQMHACWLLLAASGEVPAHLLQLRRPRYVTGEQPLVSDLDLTHPGFPRVIPDLCAVMPPVGHAPDLRAAMYEAGIIGAHPRFLRALERADEAARSECGVLILGETGTGKELLANFIRRRSARAEGPFVTLDCAGLPESLLDSELFGHVKGAFTGADRDKQGLLEAADGGTLFLDEIGDMPLTTQVKLLRAIQEKKVRPVGDTKERAVDFRIVVATHRNLKTDVQEGKFREDFYYRIKDIEIRIPSLRERRSDIPLLTMHFLEKSTAAHKKRITPEALRRLERQPWPGNVRELEHVIRSTLALSTGDVIGPEDLEIEEPKAIEAALRFLPDPYEGFQYKEFIAQVEDHLKARALEIAHGNQAEAARLLGLSTAAINKSVAKKAGPAKPRGKRVSTTVKKR